MPRPHVEFIHAQQITWNSLPFGTPPPGDAADPDWRGVDGKILSRDPANGACSVLLRYPPGWRRGPHALAASHELLVLDGTLELGGVNYGLDDYAWLPPGFPVSGAASAGGAVVLSFFDRHPGRADPAAPVPLDGLIERIDTHNMPWTSADIDPSVQFLRLAHKVLRHVPRTGEKTILLSMGAQAHPHDWREAQLRHDCVEEMYLLGGDIVGERGTMYEGAYFWRPPGEWHGPFGSRRGSLSLIRFTDGQHRNLWGERALPFRLDPAHVPVLPSEHRERGFEPWIPPRY